MPTAMDRGDSRIHSSWRTTNAMAGVAPTIIWYDRDQKEREAESIKYLNSAEQCLQTINQSSEPTILIANSKYATDLLSRVHSLEIVETIFLLCPSPREQQRCQYLLQHYSKIFDLFSNEPTLLDALKEYRTLYQRQSGNDYLRTGESYQKKNELQRAGQYTHKALNIYRKTLANANHPLIARCLNNLGGIYDSQGDVNRSFEYYEQAINIYSLLTPDTRGQPKQK
jgi:tetratricopeptide (TPR) repeat protein